MTPSTLELWRKYFTGAFGARFRKYMKDAYNEEVMRCFNESGTGLTLNNQVPQNVKELEALYCCSEFQEMVRSGNEGRKIVFQHGWDWFRALAHGDGKRWVEESVNKYLKDELKVSNVKLADGISSAVSTKEHILLYALLSRYLETPASLLKKKGNFSNVILFNRRWFLENPQGWILYLLIVRHVKNTMFSINTIFSTVVQLEVR